MSKSFRMLLIRVHRYLGLVLLGFVLVISLSGLSLVYQHELDALINPDLYAVEVPGAPSLPAAALVRAVEQRFPEVYVTHLPLVAIAERAQVVYVAPQVDAASGELYSVAYDEVFLDPGSGRVNGMRQWGECCGQENILPLLYKLHNRLLLDKGIGRKTLALIAVLWLGLSMAGLLLVLANRNVMLTWRRGLRGRAAILQFHRHFGLWALPLVLVSVISGLAVALEDEVTLPLVAALVGEPDAHWATTTVHTGRAEVGFGGALDVAKTYIAAEKGRQFEAVSIDYSRSRNQYRVTMRSAWLPGLSADEITVSAANGQVMAAREGSGAANRIVDNTVTLHSGALFGLPGRLAVSLTAVVVSGLCISGLLMWYRRNRRQ